MFALAVALVLLFIPKGECSIINANNNNKIITREVLIPYLQQEQAACTTAQQHILHTLRTHHHIPFGAEPNSLRKGKSLKNTVHDKITTSTREEPVECRLTLDRAPMGAKCVAPCGCTGSQKWVQFSVLNKLRRKDPEQWKTCQTCRQPFQFDLFAAHGNARAGLMGFLLDNRIVLRSLLTAVMLFLGSVLQIPALISSFLVSRSLWQMYPSWAQIIRIPLALKIWLLQVLVRQLTSSYLTFEKNVIVNYLADIETALIEENLPSKT